MAELTRIITIEVTVIDDVHVTVKDIILEDRND